MPSLSRQGSESGRLPDRLRCGCPRRITFEAVFWSAAAPLRRVSTRAEFTVGAHQGPEPGFSSRPRPERRGETPRHFGVS